MWPDSVTIDGTFENIIYDLASFANTKSLTYTISNNRLIADWKVRDVSKSAEFTVGRDRRITVSFNDTKSTYIEFLASPYMANLMQCAEQFLSLIAKDDNFIEPKCCYAEKNGNFFASIGDIIKNPIVDKSGKYVESTMLLFIRAQAGMGKTYAARQLVRLFSEKYLKNDVEYLFFYIDAQGRSLARLDEAIAKDVSFYGLVFSPSAVAALTRNALIIPIIDGFDELIGAGGFSDAFRSLSSFLSQLNKCGTVIATGRSVFYDDNMLSLIASTYTHNSSLNYTLYDLELIQWDEEIVKSYISKKCLNYSAEKIDALISRVVKQNFSDSILVKPFYVAKFTDIILENNESLLDAPLFETQFSFIEAIVDKYVSREVDKFLHKDDMRLPILAKEGHEDFLESLALELWWQEKRTIDQETIGIIAEIILEKYSVDADYWPVFITKSQSYALFTIDQQTQEKAFENSLYYDFFLAKAFERIICDDMQSDLKLFLSRSLLSEAIIAYLDDIFKSFASEQKDRCVETLLFVSQQFQKGSIGKRNVGQILTSVLFNYTNSKYNLNDIEIYGGAFKFVTFEGSIFQRCFFKDVRFYNTTMKRCKFLDCNISSLIIDENSSFSECEIDNSYVNKLFFSGQRFEDQEDIKNKLKEVGFRYAESSVSIVLNDAQRELLELLIGFFDRTKNRFQFDIDTETEIVLAKVYTHRLWEKLLKKLIESKLLVKKLRDRSGPQQHLYQLQGTKEELLQALSGQEQNNPRIEKFLQLFFEEK